MEWFVYNRDLRHEGVIFLAESVKKLMQFLLRFIWVNSYVISLRSDKVPHEFLSYFHCSLTDFCSIKINVVISK